jgi:hypothetical protein
MPKASRVTRELGEKLAISALAFLAEDPERLGAFLSQSGIGPQMIRKAAADPAFLAGILDHVVADEPLLRAVAEYAGVSPETVERAHLALSGEGEREVP